MNVEIDISGTIITTKRLVLRPWRQSDLEDFFEYASVDGVGQMAGWLPHRDREESQRILDHFIEKKHVFAIEYRGKVVGSLGIEPYDEERFTEYESLRCRELGFVLSKDYWGQGIMPEAVEGVLRWLFEEVGLDAVFCGHFVRNRQSARVQEKCGFHEIARGKYKTRYDTVEDDVTNIITRDEWCARQLSK